LLLLILILNQEKCNFSQKSLPAKLDIRNQIFFDVFPALCYDYFVLQAATLSHSSHWLFFGFFSSIVEQLASAHPILRMHPLAENKINIIIVELFVYKNYEIKNKNLKI
jgi:hypothetical protein